MTQKEKELLLKVLCTLLPYGVKMNCFGVTRTLESICIDREGFITIDCGGDHFYHPFSNKLHDECLPYLRPLSSMTEEEYQELLDLTGFDTTQITEGIVWFNQGLNIYVKDDVTVLIDWLIANHFDYRGLIPMGLALPAKKGMY